MPDVRPRRLGGAELATTILDSPALVQAVRELEPAVLARLVDTVGLESAGDLVALATTSQLAAVFDEDLWSPGHDDPVERFDARRFGLWLEVMLDAGEAAVVSRLCELPVDFVTLAIHGLVLVVDVDRLGVELDDAGEELDYVEKALDGSLCEEWEEFRLIARDASNWDAVVSALLALDRDHHDLLRGILERCAAMSAEYIADNGGLYEVLTAAETLEGDVAAEREDRRAARGFVSPADARSFLELARREPTSERDPITRAYFRELVRDARPKPRTRARAVSAELTRVLEAAGVVAAEPAGLRALTGNVAYASDVLGVVPELRAALAQVAREDASLHAERIEELLYVSNVLVAASRGRERQLRPPEALDAAIACAAFGLDLALRADGSRGARAESALQVVRVVPMERLFSAGFRAVYAAPAAVADRALIDELRSLLEPA
jgi:hypothetical protein